MIYKHKRTQKDYRVICESFDTERQEHHVVYMQIETGFIFNRSTKVFHNNFELVDAFPQLNISPNDPRRK